MPLFTRKRVLAAKVEATPGTEETLTAAEAAINVYDAKILKEIEFVQREGQGSFAPLPGALAAYAGRCTFKTDLIGGAAAPFWTTFARGCAMSLSAGGVLTPSSARPAASGDGDAATAPRSLTIGIYQDGRRKAIRGAMGNMKITFTAGMPVKEVEFEFRGIWIPPTDVTILAPTYPTTSPRRFAGTALTLGGAALPPIQQFTLDLGNQVYLREDSTDASGLAYAVVTGRRITGTMNPESALVATEDIYGQFLALTEQALAFTVGSSPTGVSFSAPKLQFTGVEEDNREMLEIDNIAFQLNRSAAAGEDEISIDTVL